jgi:hypothetical protein
MSPKKFKPIKQWFRESIHPGKGNHHIYRFPNGYGASVIDDGYGAEEGKFELALLKFKGKEHKLANLPPDFDDVQGWLTEAKVQKLLVKISKLKKAK